MADGDAERVHVRLYGDLAFFADGPEQDVPIGRPRSVKDLLEAVGVPHPEIDVIVINGAIADFGRRVRAGDRIAAYPPWTSVELASSVRAVPPVPRFVLDVHLGTLARRLGMLGLDVDYVTDRDDAELARVAVEEDRILLTRDRQLLMRREVVHGYCPRSDDPDEQLLEVVRRFVAEADLAPFTRCPTCNAALQVVAKADVLDQIEAHTEATHDTFQRCPGCERVYWPGTHVDAMAPIVAAARALARES